ncbi:serine-threonine protein kinase, putative [Entamoeba histolytica HM-3:IMSS]|uniref:Serine-threonine protein kinase, putative n=1 Tax=Entamoeba histolytica HM-3:IMSS TaxID=885315 RepID=M7WST4_ENTHI|nr:serine-threonine protein kinase, putative [Entamoeba histolytica HM-3:IMSS]
MKEKIIVVFVLFFTYCLCKCGDGIRQRFDEECDGGSNCRKDCMCEDGYFPEDETYSVGCVPSCLIDGCKTGCYTPDECGYCDEKGYRSDCLGCAEGYIPQGYLKCVKFNESDVKSCQEYTTQHNFSITINDVSQTLTLTPDKQEMSINTCSKRLSIQQPYAPGYWIKVTTKKTQYVAIETEKHYDSVSIEFIDTQGNAYGEDTVFVISNCPTIKKITEGQAQECIEDNDNLSQFVKLSRIVLQLTENIPYYLFVHKPFGIHFTTNVPILFTPIVHPCSYVYSVVNWPEVATSGFTTVVNTAHGIKSSSACTITEQIGLWYFLQGADRNVLISTCNSISDYYTALHLIKVPANGNVKPTIDCSYNTKNHPTNAVCERYDVKGCPEPGSHHASMMVTLSSQYDYFIFASVITDNSAAFNLTITTLCPYNCGGNGVCDKVSQTCICNDGYVLKQDSCSLCGNGKKDEGEECENIAGDNYTDPNCDYSTCSCEDGYIPLTINGLTYCAVPTCGNGKINDYEECDGGEGCQHCVCVEGYRPYESPRIYCLSNKCGNNILDKGEECDGGEGCYECECQAGWFEAHSVGCQRVRRSIVSLIIFVGGIIIWIIIWLLLLIGFVSRYIFLNKLIISEQQKDERILIESTVIKFNKDGAQYIDVHKPNALFAFESSEILFSDCQNHVEVDEDTKTVIRVTNKKNEPIRFIFHGGDYLKYTISFVPAILSVRPGETGEVTCVINVNCTCVLREKVPVTIRYGKFKQIMQELLEENPQLLELQSQSSQNTSEFSERSSKSKSSSLRSNSSLNLHSLKTDNSKDKEDGSKGKFKS